MCVGRGATQIWVNATGANQQSGNQQGGSANGAAPGLPCRASDVGHLTQLPSGALNCMRGGKGYVWSMANGQSGNGGQSSNGQGGAGSAGTTKGDSSVKPVLTRLPVNIAPWHSGATSAGSVMFTQQSKDNELGDPVGHGALWPSGKTFTTHPPEPSLTFRYLDPNATVVSSLAGTVSVVQSQPESCDAEIRIVPKGTGVGDGTWIVIYDHVRQPLVKVGQVLVPGTALGKPGPEKNGCGGPYRVELQVNKPTGNVAVCPLSVFSPAAGSAAKAALTRLMTDWNAFIGTPMETPADIAGGGCDAAETNS